MLSGASPESKCARLLPSAATIFGQSAISCDLRNAATVFRKLPWEVCVRSAPRADDSSALHLSALLWRSRIRLLFGFLLQPLLLGLLSVAEILRALARSAADVLVVVVGQQLC